MLKALLLSVLARGDDCAEITLDGSLSAYLNHSLEHVCHDDDHDHDHDHEDDHDHEEHSELEEQLEECKSSYRYTASLAHTRFWRV